MHSKKLLLLTLLTAGNLCSAYEFPASTKNIEVKDDMIKNTGKRSLWLKTPQVLKENTRLALQVQLPEKGRITLKTGRGQEQLYITRRNNCMRWTHKSVDGSLHNMRAYPNSSMPEKKLSYWWENDAYTPLGRYTGRFGLPDFVRKWSEYYRSKQQKNLNQYWLPLTVELNNRRIRWYMDNILLQDQAVTPEIYGRKLKLLISAGVKLKNPTLTELKIPAKGFYPVNLTNRANAGTKPLVKAGSRFIMEGIPFETPVCKEAGHNSVDVGTSWFRESLLTSYEQPHKGTFGGRWAGALSMNPTRIQFRVPNRPYNAIYLLVSYQDSADRRANLSAQFYRPGSGFPQNFTVKEKIKTDGSLQLVKIPVNPDVFKQFADREVIELELTGDVQVYRASPDPLFHSEHGGGMPSGVNVYAMTLGIASLELDWQPESFGNIWVGNKTVSYSVAIKNNGTEKRDAKLVLKSESYDKKETNKQEQNIVIPANGTAKTRFDLPVRKFGWHKVILNFNGEEYERSFVVLRHRQYKARPFNSKGFMFGVWRPATTHYGPVFYDAIRLVGPLGLDSISHSQYNLLDKSISSLAARYGMKNFQVSRHPYWTKYNDIPDLEEQLVNSKVAESKISEPVFHYLFAEPGGIGTNKSFPEFYGEPKYVRTPAEQEKFEYYKRLVLRFSKIFRRNFPGKKILMPWGAPAFAIPFLEDKETRYAFDGIGFDTAFFDRLPEMQYHQCSLHGHMMQFMHYWKKYRNDNPLVVTVEGPCYSRVAPGALTLEQHTAHPVRSTLLLSTYGIKHFFASVSGNPEGASYWGEQHYMDGGFSRITLNPWPAYASQGTMIRHLRHMEFVKWIDTGSLSTYCLQYKDSRNGKLLNIVWTVRGTKPLKTKSKVIYDSMDNRINSPLSVGQLPIYIYGDADSFVWGEPEHSDVVLNRNNIKLGNVADLFTRQTQNADDEYVNSFPDAIRRFPAEMQLKRTESGLAVTLPKQANDRGVMPFFTVLEPMKPVKLPGKARYITMRINAHSDWGRIVYSLRDSKGQRFISVGTKDTYNNDDTPNASYFNFDGNRLVRFELPANLPWDNYKEMGSTWWGAYDGNGIVSYPLSLEKIYIERREKAMYVNSLESANPAPVVLGDLYLEYDSPELMKTKNYVKMPAPPFMSKPYNPVIQLREKAALPQANILKITEPEHYYDGTRGHFHFEEKKNATKYDIYVSLSPDGSNAIKLGKNLKESGSLVRGFLANMDFYAFLVYYDKSGKHSQPSSAFKFNLKDNFANK